MRKGLGALGLLFVLLALPITAAAQTAQVGQVIGDVRDATGAVLPGATVTLTSPERGFSRTTVTDALGKYRFSVVPTGVYDVTVTLAKFEVKKVAGNVIDADRTTGISIKLQLASVQEKATVVGEVPVVDPTNQTLETRLRADQFQKLPFGRSFQQLISIAPGVIGTGNVNSHGALSTNNIFLFDGVNTTDPTTGTVGNSLNYEAIQEVIVRTGTVSAEFGRGTGAIVDIITKSGTNQISGSGKYLFSNDEWNQQNSAVSELDPNISLARTKFNKINPIYSGTFGGPVLRNRAWFFAAYEDARVTSPQAQTNAAPGFTPETYQQTKKAPFLNVKVSSEVKPGHSVWGRVTNSPTNDFIFDYFGGAAAEREALTLQSQGGVSYAGQYTGVFGSRWTGEATFARNDEFIRVEPFEVSSTVGGAPILDLNDGRWYNGSTFDGRVHRPRTQATAAANYFANLGGRSHTLKFGIDWQQMSSENLFRFPTSTVYQVTGFDPVTRTYTPDVRLDYDDDPSRSTGTQVAFYARDNFQAGSRATIEAGIRIERQSGRSDVNAVTVDTFEFAPRISASFSVRPDGRTLVVGSYGRFNDGILQGFSDTFAAVPQQTNFNLFTWNGSSYDFTSRFDQAAGTFMPNTDIRPRYMDEITGGIQHKVGPVMGFGARIINRKWANFVDDVRTFAADGVTINRVVQNVPNATREYRGYEFSIDRRYANRWTASGSYTYSKTTGNHFVDDFSSLNDFVGENCRQSAGGVAIDQGLGDPLGVFPCANLQTNLTGRPTYDRPHLAKFQAAFTRPMKGFDMTMGTVGSLASKTTYSKSRTVSVLFPGTLVGSGQTLTYFYEPRGNDRVSGLAKQIDGSVEMVKRAGRASVGLKFDVFNVFNFEDKIGVNNQTWCTSAATASCQTAIAAHGSATTRASFQIPRTYQFTFLVRY
jgi:hypothetical protein